MIKSARLDSERVKRDEQELERQLRQYESDEADRDDSARM